MQPGRDVHGIAHHRVCISDHPGQHLAGIYPDAERELDLLLVCKPRAELGHRLLHRQTGTHRALGIVGVCGRRAEDSHHCITDVLVDPPAEPIDLFGQPSQALVDDSLDGLGVEPFGDARVPG